MKARTSVRICLTTAVLIAATLEVRTILPSAHDDLPNFDRRAPIRVSEIGIQNSPTAVATLDAKVSDAVVDFDELARLAKRIPYRK